MLIETARLTIRPWLPRDLPGWAAINADPEVRQFYYPALLTREESDAEIDQCLKHLHDHGFAFLAIERRDDKALVGGAGLSWADGFPGGPAVEVGWILARRFWRQGYAREASQAWLAHAWSIGLERVVGYTSTINHPSRALMEALGMSRNAADDFADPTVPPGDPLSPHVLYQIDRPS